MRFRGRLGALRRVGGYGVLELVIVMALVVTVGVLVVELLLQLVRFQSYHRRLIDTANTVTDVQLLVREEISLGLHHPRGNARGAPPVGVVAGQPASPVFIDREGDRTVLHYYPRFQDLATVTVIAAPRRGDGYVLIAVRNPGWSPPATPPFVFVSGLKFSAERFPGTTPPAPLPGESPTGLLVMAVRSVRAVTEEDRGVSPVLQGADLATLFLIEAAPAPCGRLTPLPVPADQGSDLTAGQTVGTFATPVSGEMLMEAQGDVLRVKRGETVVSDIAPPGLFQNLEFGYLIDGTRFAPFDAPEARDFQRLTGAALRGRVLTRRGIQDFFLPAPLRQAD